jgi:hypothetical protein
MTHSWRSTCQGYEDCSTLTSQDSGMESSKGSMLTIDKGHYTWHALAKGLQPLMSVNQIVNTGYRVEFEPTMVAITDLWNRNSLEIGRPRGRDGMWIVPFRVLSHLTNDKRMHAPRHAERLLQQAKDQFFSEKLIRYDPQYDTIQSTAEPEAKTFSANLIMHPENMTDRVHARAHGTHSRSLPGLYTG